MYSWDNKIRDVHSLICFQLLEGCIFKEEKLRSSLCFAQILNGIEGIGGEGSGLGIWAGILITEKMQWLKRSFTINICLHAQVHMHWLNSMCLRTYNESHTGAKRAYGKSFLKKKKINLAFYTFQHFCTYWLK